MQYLSSYRLEAPYLKNSVKYTVCESVSLCLKIVALILLIVLWKYFYISIILWVISSIFNIFKRNLIYKYVYEIENGFLTIYKEVNYEKNYICERLDIKKDIKYIELADNVNKYYEKPTPTLINVVKSNGNGFALAADNYFYALLDYYKRGCI